MASSSSVLSEDQLQCSICLDVFTDPVSTSCGHNFCMTCIKEFWDTSSHCQCPVCKMDFPRRPELHVNTFISGLAAQFRKPVQKNTEKEKVDSMDIFRALIRSIERNQAEMLKVMEEKQRAAERQAEEFIKDLEQEITKLKRRNTELEQISNTEDHLHLLQIYPSLCRPPPTNNWTDVSIQPHLDVETLRRARSQLQECVDEEMKKVVSMELKRIQQYAVDVILDPDTANPELILSDDGKQVTDGDEWQDLPNNPERFYQCVFVMGKEGFSSGRFYYEVQVKGKTEWYLGVTRESSNRKGEITVSPEDGYWSVCLGNKTEYQALDSPHVLFSLKQAPQKVGVFVDYEEGLVSFYDVENESHIYSFTGQSFTEKLYPMFSPCLNDDGENSAPLIICPVSQVQS
ncbi:E3 ubiquitin-protein ligase TRIM39-like isoform X5 [Trichomycterus rosablanca]|uniref:E3 ubiquitin-protein ligase TRIM39-like isoform X5 n=1 Tax=Trichomycterus rosablanca TaxID=2290929 RepID=UPI002F35177E